MKHFNLFENRNGQFLGVLRFLFFALVYFYWAGNDHFLAWSYVPTEFWLANGLTQLLTPVHSDLPWEFIFYAWRVFLLLSAVGLMTRFSMASVFLLSFVLVAHAQSFGYFTRMLMPLLWAMGILSLSRAGDHFSLDALIRKRRGLKPENLFSPEYAWPIHLIRIVFCIVFFSAGFSKLTTSGIDWISSDTVRNFMIRAWITHFENRHVDLAGLNGLLFSQALLMKLFALYTVSVELIAPLALFVKKLRYFIIAGLFCMQIGIKFTILVNFDLYIALYIFWLPMDADYRGILARLRSKVV